MEANVNGRNPSLAVGVDSVANCLNHGLQFSLIDFLSTARVTAQDAIFSSLKDLHVNDVTMQYLNLKNGVFGENVVLDLTCYFF